MLGGHRARCAKHHVDEQRAAGSCVGVIFVWFAFHVCVCVCVWGAHLDGSQKCVLSAVYVRRSVCVGGGVRGCHTCVYTAREKHHS